MEIISSKNENVDTWTLLDPNSDYPAKKLLYITNSKSIEIQIKNIINISKYINLSSLSKLANSDKLASLAKLDNRYIVVELVKKSKTNPKYEIMSEHNIIVKGSYVSMSANNVFVKFDSVNIRTYNNGELENSVSVEDEEQLKPVYAYIISLLYMSTLDWHPPRHLPEQIALEKKVYVPVSGVLEMLESKKVKNLPMFLSILANAGIWQYYATDTIPEYLDWLNLSEAERLDSYKVKNEIYKAQTLSRLAIDKFGYSKLSPAQATTIDFVYLQNLNKKKCEHVNLFNDLIRFPSSDKWDKLKKFSKEGKEVYECNSCGLQFLCLHRVKVYEAIFEKGIKVGSEAMEAILENFINAAGESSYNCYICGEEIKARIDDRETIYLKGKYVRSAFVNDELSSRIWNFLNSIIVRLIFKSTTNTKLLASNISSFLYDYVKSAEYATQNADNEFAEAKNLHIKVYSYAAIVLFISEHPQLAYFKEVKPFEKAGDIGYVKALFKFAHSEIIRNTEIDSDLIKRMLISAYREISHYKVDVSTTKEEEIVEEFSIVSILYKYSKHVLSVCGKEKLNPQTIIKSSNINVVDDIKLPKSNTGEMDNLLDYIEKTRNLEVTEKRIRKYNDSSDIFEINKKQTSQQYDLPVDPALIYRLYDKDGNPHLFNKRVGNDLVCSVCGDSAEFAPANPGKYSLGLLKKINQKVELASFYNMYTNKCPEGGIHSWAIGNSPTCKKCSITHRNAIDNDHAFYDKYKTIYEKDKKKVFSTEYSEDLYEKKEVKLTLPDVADLFHTLKNRLGKIADFTNTVRGGNMAAAIISKCEQINNKMAQSNPMLSNFVAKYEDFTVDYSNLSKKYAELKNQSTISFIEGASLNTLYVGAILDFFISLDNSPSNVAFIELNIRFIELDRTLDEKIEFYAPKNEQTEETDVLDSEDTIEAYLEVNPFDTSNLDMTEEEIADNEKPGDD